MVLKLLLDCLQLTKILSFFGRVTRRQPILTILTWARSSRSSEQLLKWIMLGDLFFLLQLLLASRPDTANAAQLALWWLEGRFSLFLFNTRGCVSHGCISTMEWKSRGTTRLSWGYYALWQMCLLLLHIDAKVLLPHIRRSWRSFLSHPDTCRRLRKAKKPEPFNLLQEVYPALLAYLDSPLDTSDSKMRQGLINKAEHDEDHKVEQNGHEQVCAYSTNIRARQLYMR